VADRFGRTRAGTGEVRVLFVCMGKRCRSPAAEGVFRGLVREAGLEGQVIAVSAGTHDQNLDPPCPRGRGHRPGARTRASRAVPVPAQGL
jgi:protein-tyrosine phosphatase